MIDHSRSLKQAVNEGVPVVASQGTFEACKIPNQNVIKHGQALTHKDWKIAAFTAEHDAKEPLGFTIEHPECGRILFLTDSYKLKYNLGTFDWIIIEANYCEEIVSELRGSKKYNSFLEKRRLTAHMSFQTTVHTLGRMDLSKCKGIILIHLSDLMTDERKFISIIENKFGIPTACAKSNQEIQLTHF